MCEVTLPNKEISFVYSKEIMSQLEDIVPHSIAASIQESLYKADAEALQKSLEQFLIQSISFHDAANETFYHGLILGMCAIMESNYRITSNREAGEGRFDIQLFPPEQAAAWDSNRAESRKELHRYTTGKPRTQLESLAHSALQQITDRKYSTDFRATGVRPIVEIGLAFSGKRTRIATKQYND